MSQISQIADQRRFVASVAGGDHESTVAELPLPRTFWLQRSQFQPWETVVATTAIAGSREGPQWLP